MPWIPLILNDDDATFPSSFETKTTFQGALSLTMVDAAPVIVEPLANILKLYIKANKIILLFLFISILVLAVFQTSHKTFLPFCGSLN